MEDSILKSTKKMLGLPEDYTPFDMDITLFINSAFSSLSQIGVASDPIIIIEDAETKWDDLEFTDDALSLVKIFIYLKVRMLFDPPATSFLIDAITKQIAEHEWRLAAFHDSSAAETYAPEVEEVV